MRDRYGFKPDNLRNIIEKRGVNLSQIEREAGVPRSVLSRCLNGHTELCMKNAVLLANYFAVSVDYIIGRRGCFENSGPKQPTHAERKGSIQAR
ncbi:helix-turn-helix transcriptional regulator [Candidatus Saccharibacteria bacterium]|nr:helix-turn-helix transcriptional regulator [Candidatus Saccharibacteria bacterium]